MNTVVRRIIGGAAAVCAAAALTVTVSPLASADEWPTPPSEPSATGPFDVSDFLTPTDLDYWNPFVSRNRLTSPYGTSTRISCFAFHGVLLSCWQADRDGNPHKLIELPLDFPGSLGSGLPGGGPGHFVYPGFVPGIG
ncbi:hypothetical protein [Prescottella subtropica]|uniref:hypothetical protein n=1 Tax=Prescottella subtropica TaxID=2545757 RepID=UPI0010F72906|nr:hypothetical protein [Prescottella subtropica]